MLVRFLKSALRVVLSRTYPLFFWHELGAMLRELGALERSAPGASLPSLRSRSDTVNHLAITLQDRLLFGLFNSATERRYLRLLRDVQTTAHARGDEGRTFRELFRPLRRDVIYGCWEGRMIYSTQFGTTHERAAVDHQRFVKTDTFNDATVRTREFSDRAVGGSGDDLLRALVLEQIARGREVLNADDRREAAAYYELMEGHAAYRPQRLSEEASTPDGRRRLLVDLKPSEQHLPPDEQLRVAAYNRLTRRACKFGIEYAVRNLRCVHFILDGLFEDLTSLEGKIAHHDQRAPITVSELLFTYRHWSYLSRQPGRIFFYVGGRTIAPPWTDAGALATAEWEAFSGFFDRYQADRVARAAPLRGRL
ncbi:MAG TPA: hypothetical protein VFF06_21035 [Polyangia bacterium]|nr:hypothetical protein [Polyangia bacterium]